MNFFSRYKKAFLILGFLALVAVIGYFLFRVFFATEPLATPPNETETTGGSLPNANEGSGNQSGGEGNGDGTLPTSDGTGTQGNGSGSFIPRPGATKTGASETANGGLTKTALVNQSPSSGLASTNDGAKYYNSTDGKFYKIDDNGKKVALSDKVFYSVSNVTWSPAGSRAVIEYPDGSNIMYDFDADKQVSLPAHWQEFSFSSDGSQLVSKSMGLDSDNRWLVVSNADGSQAKAIEALGERADNAYASWSPNNQIVAMYTEGEDFNRQQLYFLGLNGENFKSTVIEGRGFEPQWSSDGQRLLYSVYNSSDNLNPRLWIVDAYGDSISNNRQSLNLQTWASKCTFASASEVYCAVPDELPAGAGLYPELADKTQDSLYRIDLDTGSQQLVAIPDGAYNISQIVIAENQEALYFTDKFSGSVYQVKLK